MKKSLIFYLIGLVFATICVADFDGTYKGVDRGNKVAMKLKEAGDGTISGNVKYAGINYSLSAKRESDSISDAKGNIRNKSTNRRISLKRVAGGIKVTLYPKDIKGNVVSTVLKEVLKKSEVLTEHKIVQKRIKTSKNSIVGRWVNSTGELDIRSDGYFTYTKISSSSNKIFPKRNFKKNIEDREYKISQRAKEKEFRLQMNLSNSNVQIGGQNLGNEINKNIRGENTGFHRENWRDKAKRRAKERKIKQRNQGGSRMGNSGHWKVRNNSLYLSSNNSSPIAYYGILTNNGNSLIISKNNGIQEIWNRVE